MLNFGRVHLNACSILLSTWLFDYTFQEFRDLFRKYIVYPTRGVQLIMPYLPRMLVYMSRLKTVYHGVVKEIVESRRSRKQ